MTLSDSPRDSGKIARIGGDADTHRRLADMGLLGASYTVTVRKKHAVLVDYGEFSAVTDNETASVIFVE